MFPITALGQSCWLVPFAPNTTDSVGLKARVEVDAQRGQTGFGSRRPQHYLLRTELSWIAQLTPAIFFSARAAFLAAQDELLLVPFWPGARQTTAAAVITSSLTVAWTRNWATYAVNPGSLAGYDYFAPLLAGTLQQPPRLESRNSDYVRAEFAFIENGPASAALVPPADSDVTLVTPDGALHAPIFPWSPEGSTAPSLTFGQVDVDRQALGPGRQPSSVFYPQARETVTQPSYKLKSAAAAMSLLGWWQRRGGGADACWVATTQQIGRLTGDLAPGSGTLPTVAPLGTAVGDTLALLTTGQAPEFVRVASIPSGVVHLSGATVAAHPVQWTTIVPALLARHTDQELALNFRRAGDDWLADATLSFRELAAEYNTPAGETRGTTLGRLPATAWLFRIDLDYAGATQTWYLTSWESGCTTPDAQAWAYHDCDFDKIIQSLDLEDDVCTFKIRWFAGCPWENWLTGQLAATGTLTISRAPVSSAGAVGARVDLWSGLLSTPSREGPLYSVKVLGANALFDRKAPHQCMVTTCYKRLYGARCGLAIGDWMFTAIIAAVGPHTLTIGTISRANGHALPDGFAFADWFALGFAQWTDGAGHPLRAEVLGSTAYSAGQIVLTLGRTLGWHVGDAVVVVPGCDKQAATCLNYDPGRTGPVRTNGPVLDGHYGKFNNYNQFGGFFDMPAVSPSFIIPQSNSTPAKK